MPLTTHELEFLKLALSFAVTPEAGYTVDLNDRDWQILMLRGLSAINAGITSGAPAAPVVRTPGVVTVSTSGTVAAGAKSVEFLFSEDFVGTVLGDNFSGTTDYSLPFEAPPGDTLGAIAYTRAAGSIRIKTVV